MIASENEDDLEVAEILQDQLYYNGDILEVSLMAISNYKDQSISYVNRT
jgi:replication fork protection complex subunit Tof1/Swi1